MRKLRIIGRRVVKGGEVHFFSEKDMKAKDPLIKDILRNERKLV